MIEGLKVSDKLCPISGSPIVNVSRVSYFYQTEEVLKTWIIFSAKIVSHTVYYPHHVGWDIGQDWFLLTKYFLHSEMMLQMPIVWANENQLKIWFYQMKIHEIWHLKVY